MSEFDDARKEIEKILQEEALRKQKEAQAQAEAKTDLQEQRRLSQLASENQTRIRNSEEATSLLNELNKTVFGDQAKVYSWKTVESDPHKHEYTETGHGDRGPISEARAFYHKSRHEETGIVVPGRGRVIIISPINSARKGLPRRFKEVEWKETETSGVILVGVAKEGENTCSLHGIKDDSNKSFNVNLKQPYEEALEELKGMLAQASVELIRSTKK